MNKYARAATHSPAGRITTTALLGLILAVGLTGQAQAKQDNTKVTVTFTTPASGSTFTAPANLTLTVDAQTRQTSHPVTLVEFFNGGNLIGSQTAPTAGTRYQINLPNVAPGSYTLTARATNDKGDFDQTAPVTLTVIKADQTITGFSPISPITFAPNTSFALTATGGASNNPVVFASSTPATCSVTGNTATITTAGVCTLTANQAGDANDNAALPVTATVVINQAAQTITGFNPASPITVAPNDTFTLTASGGASTNPVVFASSTPTTCTVTGNTATVLSAGTCTLTANQAGDTNYSAAPQASATVIITLRPTIAQLYYIHTDQLDTPREITDTNDNVVWQWDNSDPFGNNPPNENPNGAGTFHFDLRFPGQVFDQETNTHYNINRDYDPATGRYKQSDPIGLAGGSYSTYAYVNNNPVSGRDPTGLNPFQPSPVTALEEAVLEGNVDAIEALADAAGVPSEGPVAQATANANKINHIFNNAEHNLEPAVKACGSPGKALQILQQQATKYASKTVGDGVQEFTVNVQGFDVAVRGVLLNGVFQVGTAFIP